MASLFSGTPQTAPSYAATTTDVPKWLQDYTVDLFSQQRAVSGTPYQPYTLPRIAQTTAPTTQSQNLIESNIGAYQPAVSGAISGTQNLAGQTSVGNVGAYMNPYTQNVTDQIAKLGARNLSENLLPAVSDQFVRAGQFGSSGMGTFGGRALRDTQESILANQTNALNTGYTQALGASQADLARQQGALQQTADLAKMQQGLSTADAAALESVGAAQQNQQQKGLDVAYQDYQNQILYPQTQINNMSTTLRGLPPSAVPTTGTTSGYATTFAPSPLSTIAGAYGVVQGLSKGLAHGGLVGYADGGAVSSSDNLEQSVMNDYGQYFNTGGSVPGYAGGGWFNSSDFVNAAKQAVGTSAPVPLKDRSLNELNNELNILQLPNPGAVAVEGGNTAAYIQGLKDAIAANTANTTQAQYTASMPASTQTNSSPVVIPANIDALNAKYYQGGSPYGKYLGQGFSHGGAVPGYANEGLVDTENPAPVVDGGQAFADQYALGQQQYPTRQDAPVQAPSISSYAQDPEVLAAEAERKALLMQLQKSLANPPADRDVGPTESEKWFRRAAAFLDPGKTGSFGEGVQHFATQEAETRAEGRKARVLNAAADLQRLQARSTLAQQQYEMAKDEGKQRMIEKYLAGSPSASGQGSASNGYNTGIPDNMRALLLSQEPAEAVKTLVDMAKEQNKPSDLIRGVKFLVNNGSISAADGDEIVRKNLLPKYDIVEMSIPELGGTFKLSNAEAQAYTEQGTLPTRLKPKATEPSLTSAAPSAAPISQEEIAGRKIRQEETSKQAIKDEEMLYGMRPFAATLQRAGRTISALAKDSPNSFGYLAEPGIKNALGSVVQEGINTPWGSLSLNIEDSLAKLDPKMDKKVLEARRIFVQPAAEVEVGFRKLSLRGEGSVSNMEGQITKHMGPELSDTPRVVQIKAGVVQIAGEKQEAIINGYDKYKATNKYGSPQEYYRSPEYNNIVNKYENKYYNFAKNVGIPVTPPDKLTGSNLFDTLKKDPRWGK